MKKSGLADSPFFRDIPPPAPQETQATAPVRPDDRTDERANGGDGRTPVRVFERGRPQKRLIKRHAFEIYEDQLETLKKRKAEAMLSGQEKSMSEMVRNAIDRFLEKEE